ncbi:uncharacterized protein [Argopecten irradians]|uniref:uncharacterized protein isoform X1 n=2 Tax=Argopecten irradians TaxID=31199 RepID=UPI0037231BE7
MHVPNVWLIVRCPINMASRPKSTSTRATRKRKAPTSSSPVPIISVPAQEDSAGAIPAATISAITKTVTAAVLEELRKPPAPLTSEPTLSSCEPAAAAGSSATQARDAPAVIPPNTSSDYGHTETDCQVPDSRPTGRCSSNRSSQPLGTTQLLPVIEHLLTASLAPSSRNIYDRALKYFQEFAVASQFDPFSQHLCPSHISLFVAHLYYHKFSPRTISTYLSAIAYVHKLLHRSDPTASFLVKKVVAGAYRLAPSMDMRLPITVPILDRLIQAVVHTATTAYYRVLFQAMFLFAFNTFARVGEITMTGNNQNNLLLSDVQLEQPSSGLVINVFFSRFKHNPNNARHKISFGHGPTKSSAAKALHDYLLLRGSNSGPLFVIPGNTPVPRPLFDRQLHRSSFL